MAVYSKVGYAWADSIASHSVVDASEPDELHAALMVSSAAAPSSAFTAAPFRLGRGANLADSGAKPAEVYCVGTPVEQTSNSKDAAKNQQAESAIPSSLGGEIIEQVEDYVICWVTVAPGKQVRVRVPIASFGEVKIDPGRRFKWSPSTGAISAISLNVDPELDKLYGEFRQKFPTVEY